MNYVKIIINDIPCIIDAHTVREYPALQSGSIVIPVDITARHAIILLKILKREVIVPIIDLGSHRDVYIVVKAALAIGITDEAIVNSFGGWATHEHWAQLLNGEYLYLLHLLIEELVDFRVYFRTCKDMEFIRTGALLPELRANTSLYIEYLDFFRRYKFETCFDGNDARVQKRVAALIAMRNKIHDVFLIDPYSIREYLVYTPPVYAVWDCANISIVRRYERGEPVIVDREVFAARFTRFTGGIFDRGDFPFDRAVIAGGSITRLLDCRYEYKNSRQADVDIFICGADTAEQGANARAVIEWFDRNCRDVYYAINRSVVSVYIKDIPRKFQIIASNNRDIYTILNGFDMTHVQWCYNGRFHAMPGACVAARERVTRDHSASRMQVERMIKALRNGYSIMKSPAIIDRLDITKLIETPNGQQSKQLAEILRDMHRYYIPRDEPDLEPDELSDHIKAMVIADSGAASVTMNIAEVLDNIVIGGSFENGYNQMLFDKLVPADIRVRNFGAKTIVRTANIAIILTSNRMRVHNILHAGDMTIQLHPDPEFIQFCAMLETTVFRMYIGNDVDVHLVNDGILSINIEQYVLLRCQQRGRAILKSNIGAPLHIEEDLRAGDEIIFAFTIHIHRRPGRVCIVPAHITKYCDAQVVATTIVRPAEDIGDSIAYE